MASTEPRTDGAVTEGLRLWADFAVRAGQALNGIASAIDEAFDPGKDAS